jgi:acetyl esterase/lipase
MLLKIICVVLLLSTSVLFTWLLYKKQDMDWSTVVVAESTKLFIGLYPKEDLSNLLSLREMFNFIIRASDDAPMCNETIKASVSSHTWAIDNKCKKLRRIVDYTLFDRGDSCSGISTSSSTGDHTCTSFDQDGIEMRIYEPYGLSGGNKSGVVIWVHGGGFIIGHHHDNTKCIHLANLTNSVVISIEYRLAPEWPFPYGRNDVLAAIKWIASEPSARELLHHVSADPSRIVLVGESAGGHHIASIMLDLKNEDAIKGIVLIYPEIEYGGNFSLTESEVQHSTVSGILTKRQDDWFWMLYLGREYSPSERQTLAKSNYRINLLNAPSQELQFSRHTKVLVVLAEYDVLYRYHNLKNTRRRKHYYTYSA